MNLAKITSNSVLILMTDMNSLLAIALGTWISPKGLFLALVAPGEYGLLIIGKRLEIAYLRLSINF